MFARLWLVALMVIKQHPGLRGRKEKRKRGGGAGVRIGDEHRDELPEEEQRATYSFGFHADVKRHVFFTASKFPLTSQMIPVRSEPPGYSVERFRGERVAMTMSGYGKAEEFVWTLLPLAVMPLCTALV